MASENFTVHVSNIEHNVSQQEIHDFFTFCGKIEDVSLTPTSQEPNATLSATVTFQKESAARTALLLDNTVLNGLPVHVAAAASLSDLSHSAEQHAHEHDEELHQEDKPRTAVLAEYLAQGYVIGDKALQRGIELDEKHGISARFTAYLNNLNNKLKATDKARAADTSYGISTRANQGYNTVARYFETALNTPTGQRVRAFYEKGSKQVLDIHHEARRLADLRAESTKGSSEKPAVETAPETAPASSSSEKTT